MNRESLIKQYIELILVNGLGLNISDPNLSGTPERVAKMYCHELFKNIGVEFPAELMTVFPNKDSYSEIILADNIPFTSICSHHLLPFTGIAWFMYIPKDSLVGASKMSRIISHYAARPQLQETLTNQIVKRFEEIVNPQGTMLIMRALHNCMICRGVKTGENAGLVTSIVTGAFKENLATRNEALQLLRITHGK